MRFSFTASAKLEFFEAIAWYDAQRAGLGREFASEVIEVLRRARLRPELFPKAGGRARKIRLRRFGAYSIYFAVKEDVFSVMVIYHGARDSKSLAERLK